MEEIWKDIKNYNGYQVSNLGRVRTKNKISYAKKHGERHWKDRILKYKGSGYRTGYAVDLWKNGKPKTFLVARLVAFTFFEKDINDKSLTVDHLDGNRFNNNINNLELVSLKENIQRAFKNGLMPYKKVMITNKNNNHQFVYRSMAEASLKINRSHSYISNKLKKGINENKTFKWELVG